MAWQGGSSRAGLSSRAGVEGQVQIHIGEKPFDFDSQVESLRRNVGMIKQVASTIHEEQKKQGELIDSLDDTMERARLALGSATKKLNHVYKQAQSHHLLVLVIFAMALFFGVYVIARMYRLKKGLIG